MCNVSRARFTRPGKCTRNNFPHDDSEAVSITCKRCTLRLKYLVESGRKKTPKGGKILAQQGGKVGPNLCTSYLPSTRAQVRREKTCVLWATLSVVHGHTRASFGIICALSLAARTDHEHLDTRYLHTT